jgi:cob(I)alamin adenosyltransferase
MIARGVSWCSRAMVKLDRITTRGGDAGETSLGDGARVAKSSPRIVALGEVDETNAVLGLARLAADTGMDRLLARVQNDLFDLGADLAVPHHEGAAPALRITPAQIDWLEAQVTRLNAELPALTSFILPGGAPSACWLHLARTVARRAERAVVHLAETAEGALNPLALIYLNRLSDLLFVMARAENAALGGEEKWVPAQNRHG